MKKITTLWMMFLVISITTAQQSAENMLDNVLSAVVSVGVYKIEGTKQELGFRGKSDVAYDRMLDLSDAYSKGSGYVIEIGGRKYVCTNAHVVEKAKNESGAIYIFSITRNKYEVKIKGGDSFYDYALLEFVTPPGSEVTSVKYSDAEPRVGQKVYAIGNPLAEYPYTVSDGIISAKNRVRDGLTGKYGFIQSTATIIWGNSGGPLVNEAGEVVGMNSQIAFGPEEKGSLWQPQINFALEAKICKRLTDDIMYNNGRIRRAFVGVEISQNYDVQIDYYTQKSTVKRREDYPFVSNVFANSPAEKVLENKIGYSIYKVNGVDVRNMEEVLGAFESTKPNSSLTMTIGKSGSKETVTIYTKELEPTRMEGLAKSMIESDPSYTVTSTTGNVYITYKQAYTNYYEQRYQSKWQPSNEYKVIGVGAVTDKGTDVWRVENLSDLGVGIRFYGLAGFYDLVTTDKFNPQAKPQSTRIYLSGDQNVYKRTLWY
ncbi:MAG: serine protease [Chitinophagales bacterium]|nr:serine protease [Chitinophagales bacterium]